MTQNEAKRIVLHELRDGREMTYRELLQLVGGDEKASTLKRVRSEINRELGPGLGIKSRRGNFQGESILRLVTELEREEK